MSYKILRNNDEGFTLLEVMVGLALLAGVVVTVLTTLNYHLGVAAYSRDLVTASVLGRNKVEEVALYGLPKTKEGEFAPPLEKYKWELESKPTELEELRRVDVRIEWDSKNTVDFTSFMEVN